MAVRSIAAIGSSPPASGKFAPRESVYGKADRRRHTPYAESATFHI